MKTNLDTAPPCRNTDGQERESLSLHRPQTFSEDHSSKPLSDARVAVLEKAHQYYLVYQKIVRAQQKGLPLPTSEEMLIDPW